MNTAKLLLEDVKRVREGNESHRHTDFARHMLRIPTKDFFILIELFPALMAADPAEKTKAWEEFERSDMARAYRVGDIHRGVIKNGVIAK